MGLSVEKSYIALKLKEGQIPVSVDLPLRLGIPMDYVTEQNLRLRLYRRLANIDSETDLDALVEEFSDRFGPMPEAFQNLILQLRVKIKAEAAGLASVIAENDQIVLRFPSLPEGVSSRNLPELGFLSRAGKNSYWMAMGKDEKDWQERLFQLLSAIIN
jgi:transcription-repair coupling factor (superfamily II helicase)